jgi:5-amino-6-(5-phosphoribosylamino)uracil reductase/diaminohydroxyphosphoribosylaminopyrimidine deaminase/5-amino-6-(5-phosphoribosylamino)uracil reductase
MARPSVTLCYTQTLDGRLATSDGESQWIGGGESVAYWHQLRAEHDAVLVGLGTVLKDNPRLTVRHVQGRDPLRVVVDSMLRMPHSAALLAGNAAMGTVVMTTTVAPPERAEALRALGATVVALTADPEGRVALPAMLAALSERGITSVMVEGGARLITALLRLGLADRAVVCVAPRIMGQGTEAVGDLGVRRLVQMPALADMQLFRFGLDYVFDGRLIYSDSHPTASTGPGALP